MVQLSLFFPKGNQAARYFPYHGYLGLTPIKVEGGVSCHPLSGMYFLLLFISGPHKDG
jgi:hypothetical protein